MKISDKGLDLIKKYESYRSNAYICPAGYWTIGWGNRYYTDGSPVKEGDFIYSKDASKLLEKIVEKFEGEIEGAVEAELMQCQWDAIVCFVYNIGITQFKKSTLLKKLNVNPCDPSIIDEFQRWNKSKGQVLKGLTRRRRSEAYLYNNEETWKD